MTLYKALNKKLDGLQATLTTHSLWDLSTSFTDDQKLQKVLAFNSQYENLFRLFLDPISSASVNQPTAFNLLNCATQLHLYPEHISTFNPQAKKSSSLVDHAAKSPNLNEFSSVKKQYKSSNGQNVRKRTKKTHNVVNLASYNNKDIALNNNLISIHDNTSFNSTEKSDEDINGFIPLPQEAVFDQILLDNPSISTA